MDVDCSDLSPAQRAGLRIAVPKGVCAMSKPIFEDPAGHTGSYYVLSRGEAEACAMMGVDEGTYLERCGGRATYLSDRRERLRLSRERDGGADRRRFTLEVADQLGLNQADRKVVELELDREEGA